MSMKTTAETLRELYERSGYSSYRKLAFDMDYAGESSVQRYFKDGSRKKKYLPPEIVEKFASAFVGKGSPPITEEEVWFLAGLSSNLPKKQAYANRSGNMHTPTTRNSSMNVTQITKKNTDLDYDMVPVYGPVVGSSPECVLFTEEYVVGYEEKPHELKNIKDGFRMYVQGDSMAPRHEPGEKVSVNPHQFPSVNQDCVIVMEPDGNAIIKKYMGKADRIYKFRQLNPIQDIELDVAQVRAIYSVVR
jgi:phage repressor protein C with HTH and peptisase S24 domain